MRKSLRGPWESFPCQRVPLICHLWDKKLGGLHVWNFRVGFLFVRVRISTGKTTKRERTTSAKRRGGHYVEVYTKKLWRDFFIRRDRLWHVSRVGIVKAPTRVRYTVDVRSVRTTRYYNSEDKYRKIHNFFFCHYLFHPSIRLLFFYRHYSVN